MIYARKVFTNPIHFLAFGFGSGLSKIGPGTMGTLVAIPIYLLFNYLTLPYYILFTVLATLFAIWVCGESAKDIGVHDYSGIVLDEIVGFFWVMIAVPPKWYWILAGFLLFRLFDIWKPFPISWIDEHTKGGFGIVIDDVIAAIYAWLFLQVLVLMFP